MIDIAAIKLHVGRIFEERLNLSVPSFDTDLIASGGLDSLSFVDLLAEIERDFRIKIALEDLEIVNFQSIDAIAGFIAGYGATPQAVNVPH